MLRKKNLPQRFMITDADKINALAAAEKLPRNSGIILRDYNMNYASRRILGLALKKICVRKKIILLVANDAKLAIEINADGIHLPEYAAGKISFWRRKKPGWIITAAAHSGRAVRYAIYNNVDALLVSPIFKTSSHAGKPALGILRAIKYVLFAKKMGVAVYALGGIKPKHDNLLKMAKFQGFAAISRFKN